MREAVSLFSGSLSSSVSTEIAVNHCDLDRVIILTFRSPFFSYYEEIKNIANHLWPDTQFRSKSIKRRTENIASSGGTSLAGVDSFCLRCKLALLKTGGEFLDRMGADFLVSGETAGLKGGERVEDLVEIERLAGVEGLVFRPLSSNFSNSLPKRRGCVPADENLEPNKEESVRSLASKFGLKPETGFFEAGNRCKLTSPRYRRRLKDLVEEKHFNVNDLRLLDFEEYFKITPNAKMVLANSAEEKRELHNYFLPRDLRFYLPNRRGPMGLVRSNWDSEPRNVLDEVVNLAAKITVAKSEVDGRVRVPVNYRFEDDNETYSLEVLPLESRKLTELSL
ncbi:MAG: hypothetical protein ABEJ25_06610 [Candidatus Bipolaricaulia bacterium]